MAEKKGVLAEFFYEVVYPALGIIGTCSLIAYFSGGIQLTPVRNVQAQQVPSRAWTREDSLIAKIMKKDPMQFCTQKGEYFLTPLAASTLESTDLGGRYWLKDIKGEHLPVIITDEDILAEAARQGEDNIIIAEEIISSYKELTKEFRDEVITR